MYHPDEKTDVFYEGYGHQQGYYDVNHSLSGGDSYPEDQPATKLSDREPPPNPPQPVALLPANDMQPQVKAGPLRPPGKPTLR
ncbi:hypothetical protein FRB90_004099, partial [Tulasnella sp. 427]